ncbi:MAG: hypothetical protein HUU55_04500 [Myxococcales bacterium]|nr:hypothetical protein [Myxococcales bacterium]
MNTRCMSLTLCSILLILGCADRSKTSEWLEQGRQAKERATAYAKIGEPFKAIVILQNFVELTPPELIAADDARIVMQSTFELLGRLELAVNDPQSALRMSELCLNEGLRNDLFTARCWALRGMALERIGNDRLASDAYLEAQRLNLLLLEKLARHSAEKGDSL